MCIPPSLAWLPSPLPQIAIVGYTNAGKSSLLCALSKSGDVGVEDRLFATLDPTLRWGPSSWFGWLCLLMCWLQLGATCGVQEV